ncbi:hypothetical protein [Prevotella disiens]|uniref:hypothetical protein n=2 Tax=Prevotella TaxID=838 RepID=UPI00204AAC5D|nr:hypothetical protein [Prevotella disiens]DAU28931.1 MAG TPA: Protein of unknown function (DUF1670) [Caudoviricetes sp.]
MKYIRMSLVKETFGNVELTKALAMAYLIKHNTQSSNLHNYSINLIHSITGMHATTIKKRLRTLKEHGLVFVEKNNLIFRSTVSKHKNRNMNIGRMDFKNVKSVERSLQALQVILIQQRKDFCKHTIHNAHYGYNQKKIKTAQKVCRKYGYGNEYKEKGLSYKTIAKKIGVSIATTVEIVKMGVGRKFFKKFSHFVWTFLKGVNYLDINGYTFTTANYGFQVKANTYKIGSKWRT